MPWQPRCRRRTIQLQNGLRVPKRTPFSFKPITKDATLGQAMSVNMVQPRGCWQTANAVATWQKQATKNPLDGGFSGLLAATTQWRPRSESNRRTRLCRPLTYVIYHSLTAFDTHFATRSGVCFRPRLCENTELPSSMCRLHCLLINNSLYFFTERSCRFRSG